MAPGKGKGKYGGKKKQKNEGNNSGEKQKHGGKTRQERKSNSEATRIRVSQILEQFRNSKDEVHTFESFLPRDERAIVHMLSSKMGMKSKSYGVGQKRRISVTKIKSAVEPVKGKENLVSFKFSEDSKAVLQDLFSRYPPDEVEMAEKKVEESSGRSSTVLAIGDDMFCKPVMTESEIASKVESLASKMEKGQLIKIAETRSRLPIASFKDNITSTIESNQVVLVCGETGCGKTTQVPQFILDHAWSKGQLCKIVCTQPRRISATSVAERIASERAEYIGDSVGYKIRLETKGGRNSSLVFCTNGVLLRLLVEKGSTKKKTKSSKKKKPNALSEITHIVVDEIHERDRFSDFMLAILRDMLPSYPSVRLVLMSATIDADRFSNYFGGCPVIQVPGFTYPVKSFYLEDVLSILRLDIKKNESAKQTKTNAIKTSSLIEECRVALDEAIDLALSNDEFDPLVELISQTEDRKAFNYQHSKTGITPLMVFARKGRVSDICMLLSLGVDCNLRCNEGKTAYTYAAQANQTEAADIINKHDEKEFTFSEEDHKLIDEYLSKVDPELVDIVLIEQLLRKICDDSMDGAILVFLPGWDDINKTKDRLLASPFFNNSSKFAVFALHSMVPSVEQKKVFKRPAIGCRKIILSTNIAETSITIDDVVYVIDSGRMKEKNYDPYNNVSTLQSSWISKASMKQREGRAGRCQPGICYHLYTKLRADSLPDFQVPEIKRMPIEELCLQAKLIDPSCKIETFLNKLLDPPIIETLQNAITVLQDIGALTPEEKLTLLGEKFGSLPTHPVTSKMLFLAILLNCLGPALTLACASEYRDPFIIPMLPEQRKKADTAISELASFYGGHGDQLSVVAAFECWEMAKSKGEEARFCSQYFISSGTMVMLSGMRKQLERELFRNGFLPKDSSRFSSNAREPGILHAVLVGGLYPMVGRVISKGKKFVVETSDGNKVRLHPHSVNSRLLFKNCSSQPFVMFDEITRGDAGLYIRKSNVVGSLPLLLLANEMVVAPTCENDGDGNGDGNGNGNGDGNGNGNGDGNGKSDVDGDGKGNGNGGGDGNGKDGVDGDGKGKGDVDGDGKGNGDGDGDGDSDGDDSNCEDDDGSDEDEEESGDLSEPKQGEKIMSSPENDVKAVIDRWLPFGCKALDVAQIYCLRERLSAAILYKVILRLHISFFFFPLN
ncbi:hypothetical protein ABFS83_13G008200 [Erythranthe nasuta]